MHCQISESEAIGRYLTASKDLSPGDVIFYDSPAAIGPDYNSLPSCLGCHGRPQAGNNCRGCGWPLCKPDCAWSPLHVNECRVLANSRVVISDLSRPSRYYDAIFALRVLLLKFNDPGQYSQIMSLMDHGDSPLDPSSASLRDFIADFLLKTLSLPVGESEVHRLLGILCINSFILQEGEEGGLAGIYPMASLLSHGCVSNTKIITGEDYTYSLEALSDLPTGEMLVFNYTHYTYHLLGTRPRRAELKATWAFDCECTLCLDPTEGSAYLSALACRSCKAGKVLANHPLESSPWTCEACGFTYSHDYVDNKLRELRSKIDDARGDHLATEKLLQRLPYSLSENHYLILELKRSLIESSGEDNPRLSGPEAHHRKISHCDHLLRVIDLIFPGRCELRGFILYEKSNSEHRLLQHAWLRMRISNKDYVSGLRRLLKDFEDVVRTFTGIKASFFEGKLCRLAGTALSEVHRDIGSLSKALDWTSKRP